MPFWAKALLSVLAMQLLGGLGAFLTSNGMSDWYANLVQPPGTPPSWVFGPVWTTLYAMIGIAFALVWHRVPAGQAKRMALIVFAVQLSLNLAWTPLFFGAHQIFAALLTIIALWLAIIATVVCFYRQDRLSALLLVPYWLWVSYASYLNAGYWWLNR